MYIKNFKLLLSFAIFSSIININCAAKIESDKEKEEIELQEKLCEEIRFNIAEVTPVNVEKVKQLILQLKNINMLNKYGQTVLMEAISNRVEELVPFLLENKADVNIAKASGRTAIIYAAFKCSSQKVFELLINAGADVNFDGCAPLDLILGIWVHARMKEDEWLRNIANLLLKAGANIDTILIEKIQDHIRHGYAHAKEPLDMLLAEKSRREEIVKKTKLEIADKINSTILQFPAVLSTLISEYTIADFKEIVALGLQAK